MRNVIAQDLSQAVDNAISTSQKRADLLAHAQLLGAVERQPVHSGVFKDEGKILQSKINMPLPANASLSRYEADVMTGFTIHEMGPYLHRY